MLALKELCNSTFAGLELHTENLAYLNHFAVAFRYPGESASREQAKYAIKIMKDLRMVMREEMELKTE